MKKIEILKLIEANRIINKNQKLLSITKDKRFNNNLNEENWFPVIEELKEEFDILRKEVHSALSETNVSKNYINNSKCAHDVRLKHYGLFTSDYKCIFCGKSIVSDNCVNWEYSSNRNKYCVNLVAKYQEDEDCGYIKDGYTNEEIYQIIIDILKDKQEDEDVDLIKEFKKLNLPKCEINEEPKILENYILIIGGTNKQYIDNESYLHQKSITIGLDFTKYFSELLNIKVELVDNEETIENEKFGKYFQETNYNLKFTKYNTIEELEKTLHEQKEIPFKIIIDISELYEYKIDNNKIYKEPYQLNLNKYFPNSHIIKINNLSQKRLEELSEYLKNIPTNKTVYAYQNQNYYYLEKEEVKSDDLEKTCNKIKRKLIN